MAANGAAAVTTEEVEELRKKLEELQVGMRFDEGLIWRCRRRCR